MAIPAQSTPASPPVSDSRPVGPPTPAGDRPGRSARPSTGPRPPTSLSPSRAADFMRCPLLYRFRVIDRLPEKPSEAATRGTVVHAVLERLFDAPAAERTAARARSMVAGEWERLRAARPELDGLFTAAEGAADPQALAEWLRSAERLVDRWFTLEDPTRLEPAEREMYVETVLESGLTLRGYVDRLDVAPVSGDLRVVDYKTGRAPRPQYADEPLFQMRFYALVLWRLRGVVPRRLQLVYLGSGDVVTYDPTQADLLRTERRLLALWDAIRTATESGDWRPRRGPLCGWCDHQAVCPEFGGTPPPYPLPTTRAGRAAVPEPTAATLPADAAPGPATVPVPVSAAAPAGPVDAPGEPSAAPEPVSANAAPEPATLPAPGSSTLRAAGATAGAHAAGARPAAEPGGRQ